MKHSIESLGRQFADNSVGGGGAVSAIIHGQITLLERKLASNQKPYFNLELSDGGGTMKMKVWNNSPAYPQCVTAEEKMKAADAGPLFVALDGMFRSGEYGFESNDFRIRVLNDDEIDTLLNGTIEQQTLIISRWALMRGMLESIKCPVLRQICIRIADSRGEEYRRAAAARGRHHARRGGLVEHVSLMMKTAELVCGVYPHLNRSLLLAGVFLHDIGKLVENQYEERGFGMPFTADAEMFGHIAIGLGLVQSCAAAVMAGHSYNAEELAHYRFVIDSLCHLILAHHGQLDWGSPVEPKIPEAAALHYIDNLDAKLEGMRFAYVNAGAKKEGDVIEKKWPMSNNLVVPPKEPNEKL